MADIKTRDAVKGTIKTIDKAAIATERMKSAYAKTKDKAEQGYYADESSATEYAADRLSYGADRIKDDNANNLSVIGIYPAKKSNRVFRTKHFALMRKFRARGRPSLNDRHRLFQG